MIATRSALLTRDSTEGLADAFLELPRLVYRDDPMWIPEDPEARVRAFSADNPWFRTGRARSFCVPGRARAAAFSTGRAIEGRPAAFFGCYESTGDVSASARVMAEAEAWARGEGAEVLYGPIDFSTFGSYRLRLAAEPGAVTFPGEPYNAPSYPAELERLGYRPHQHYATRLGPFPRLDFERKLPIRDAVLAGGYRLEPLSAARWLALLPELHRLIDGIFAQNFAYTPPTDEEFSAFGRGVAARMCPHTSMIAHAPDGEIAGFFLIFPHYGPLVVQGAGEARVPLARLNYATHVPLLESHGPVDAIAKTIGVTPEHRGRGVMDALSVAALERARDRYRRWFSALVRMENPSGRLGMREARGQRLYGLFAKDLSR